MLYLHIVKRDSDVVQTSESRSTLDGDRELLVETQVCRTVETCDLYVWDLEDGSCEIRVMKTEPEAPSTALLNCRQRVCTYVSILAHQMVPVYLGEHL
jgi:hypothetical protein